MKSLDTQFTYNKSWTPRLNKQQRLIMRLHCSNPKEREEICTNLYDIVRERLLAYLTTSDHWMKNNLAGDLQFRNKHLNATIILSWETNEISFNKDSYDARSVIQSLEWNA